MSSNDNAFFPSIDDIDNETEENSRKISLLWNFITYRDSTNPGVPVCKSCNFVFSIKTGNSSIERHLLSQHNIVIPKVKKQTTLKFACKDPWPTKEKLERDNVVVIWIIASQQPFSILENESFIKMMNTFDP